MADITRRFRSGSTRQYAEALLWLVQYARGHEEDFLFGPRNVRAMREHGLTVSGPEAVVGPLTDLLEREVPGLYRYELAAEGRLEWPSS